VATYIQSGNVVFHADAKNASKAATAICASIEETFGFQTHILVRTGREMERIQAANPYPEVENVHVMFLSRQPEVDRISLLDPSRSSPDQFTVLGSEIYLFMPNGMGRTKLTNGYFDSKLGVVSTARNWRTVQKVLEMMDGRA